MRWYEKVIAAHRAVTDAVSHGARLKSERYFVWQEDGRSGLEADNFHADGAVTGVTDLFTKRELDPWAEELGEALDRQGLPWRLRDAQYEPETGFWHYTWDWEATDG